MHLKIIAFISGAVLMALEIVGSRVLAPFFGSSIFVWGSLIGVFLGALSIGYFVGGMIVDRHPTRRLLAGVLTIAGLFTILIPTYSSSLCHALSMNIWLGTRLPPLVASIVIFLPPSLFMGMVSPIIVRLATNDIRKTGTTAGTVFALGSLGSIAGTFTAAFFLIPALGTRNIVFSLGIILIVTSITLVRKTHRVLLILTLLIGGGIALAHHEDPTRYIPLAGKKEILFEADTDYHHIIVFQATYKGKNIRFMLFDNLNQGRGCTDGDVLCDAEYVNYFHLALIFKPDIKDVLFIGCGAGSGPLRFHQDYPSMEIDVVDIDPVVFEVVERFFIMKPSQRLKTYTSDGRIFLENCNKNYDFISIDAYNGSSIPFHLTTLEFVRLVKRNLTEDGVAVANLVGSLEGEKSRLFRAIYKTYQAVFKHLYLFVVTKGSLNGYKPTEKTNLILIATDRYLDETQINQIAYELGKGKVSNPLFYHALSRFYANPIWVDDVPLLTDDHAPVEILLR